MTRVWTTYRPGNSESMDARAFHGTDLVNYPICRLRGHLMINASTTLTLEAARSCLEIPPFARALSSNFRVGTTHPYTFLAYQTEE